MGRRLAIRILVLGDDKLRARLAQELGRVILPPIATAADAVVEAARAEEAGLTPVLLLRGEAQRESAAQHLAEALAEVSQGAVLLCAAEGPRATACHGVFEPAESPRQLIERLEVLWLLRPETELEEGWPGKTPRPP